MDEKPKRGRPAKDDAKVVVTLRLRPAVIAAYEALGSDWRARMEGVLISGLTREGGAPARAAAKSPLVVDGDLAVATKSFTAQAGRSVTLQLGPTQRKYGDLAKKGKGK